jgi:hypothetical protein
MKPNTSIVPLLLFLALPGVVAAQVTTNEYASVQAEHDSNVFRVPNSAAAFALNGDSTLADTDLKYVAGLAGTYLWDQQKLTGTFEGRWIEYDHFNDLNHFEYLANIELDWKLNSKIDGMLQYREERTAASFADRQSLAELELNTDTNIVGKLNYNISPLWRLETGLNYHTLETPTDLSPDYTEHEVGTRVGISYLGIAHLTYGIRIEHINGDFLNTIGVGPYTQTSALFNANYAINGLSSLAGSVGYTKRDQNENNGSISTVTGNVAYSRQLTAKTSVNVQLVRGVNSYVIAGGSEIDTTALLGATWRATYRVAVTANAGYTRSTFEGQNIPSQIVGRLDNSPLGSLNVTYQILEHLQLKGYVSKQDRDSNVEIYNYHDTTVGIQITGYTRAVPTPQ